VPATFADTLRLPGGQASGQVLDFRAAASVAMLWLPPASLGGAGLGSLNISTPQNQGLRGPTCPSHLGLIANDSGYAGIWAIQKARAQRGFDTVICLGRAGEHLYRSAAQLNEFAARMKSAPHLALMNWYFFKGHQEKYPFSIR